MNKDQIAGTLEQISGKIKQGVGEAVGNEKLANEGLADKVKGAAQETWGALNDGVKEIQDFRKEPASHDKDENLQDKVEEFKRRHTA